MDLGVLVHIGKLFVILFYGKSYILYLRIYILTKFWKKWLNNQVILEIFIFLSMQQG